ncbi:putative ribosomal protein YlxQ [bioreactor metagenome]|uniref:Putative ribosomal protein YlxQ n=1 Tax=bioreactor metagenome TaxID=1076179 RepID=A0A644T196_9ZZZZ|nr:ribosomal L7Ae/L30e/S12e/Gadd45 family protein [Negativicutes bacterium]
MDNRKFLSMLGLAMKARKVVSGEVAVETAVKAGKAKLVIIAEDASENTKKNYRDMAHYYKVPVYEGVPKADLGLAIGKASRAAIAVLDDGFSKLILKGLSDKTMRE